MEDFRASERAFNCSSSWRQSGTGDRAGRYIQTYRPHTLDSIFAPAIEWFCEEELELRKNSIPAVPASIRHLLEEEAKKKWSFTLSNGKNDWMPIPFPNRRKGPYIPLEKIKGSTVPPALLDRVSPNFPEPFSF